MDKTVLIIGTLDTKGGPKTTADGQVVDDMDRAIPGLYGVGNCVASPSARAYWAGGGTLRPRDRHQLGDRGGLGLHLGGGQPTRATAGGRSRGRGRTRSPPDAGSASGQCRAGIGRRLVLQRMVLARACTVGAPPGRPTAGASPGPRRPSRTRQRRPGRRTRPGGTTAAWVASGAVPGPAPAGAVAPTTRPARSSGPPCL